MQKKVTRREAKPAAAAQRKCPGRRPKKTAPAQRKRPGRRPSTKNLARRAEKPFLKTAGPQAQENPRPEGQKNCFWKPPGRRPSNPPPGRGKEVLFNSRLQGERSAFQLPAGGQKILHSLFGEGVKQ